MYRIGRGVTKSKRRHVRNIAVLCVLAGIVGGLVWLYQFMQDDGNELVAPKAITREYAPVQANATKSFDAPEFHLDLPSDWTFKEHQAQPFNMYIYQATAKNADNRWVTIYVDSLPPAVPVNKIRPVALSNGVLEPTSQISDNCYDIAGSKPVIQQTYADIAYQCDVANYARNVVGIGIAGQGTALKLGKHRFIITYTDHNMRPNYQILDDMLKTFSVKG